MSAKPRTDWEAIEREYRAGGSPQADAIIVKNISDVLHEAFGGPESGVTRELLFQIEQGVLAEAYGWPPIISAVAEFPVPRGRIDLMLFHADGTGTVVECKASRNPRDLLPAVGQVMSYAVQVGYGRSLKGIRKAIASRATAADLAPIREVYRQCGIEPMFCGNFGRWAAGFVELVRQELGSGNVAH